MEMELIKTSDGSSTLYLPEMDEQYHSVHGAVTESGHVFIQNGLSFYPKPGPVVFEVGFGTGLNSLLAAHWAEKEGKPVFYMAVEKYPLSAGVTDKLNYGRFVPGNGKELFSAIHACEWGRPVSVTSHFRLLKIRADFTQKNGEPPQPYHVVFYDAFGPDKQPEMWTGELFSRIYNGMEPGGVFVTYSAKGEVRRRLAAAGFSMERIPGPPGKKEMLRGRKM
jgi:tRNA U34 5-methylaminomethyl-2-thiouridine-forming methyltransferase MnmC